MSTFYQRFLGCKRNVRTAETVKGSLTSRSATDTVFKILSGVAIITHFIRSMKIEFASISIGKLKKSINFSLKTYIFTLGTHF